MICFNIRINGQEFCTAGIDEPGDLHLNILWVLRRSERDLSGTPGTADEGITFSLSGQANSSREYLSWLDQILQTGDEVVVRIVNSPAADPPVQRIAVDEDAILASRRELFNRLKKEFEPEGR